MVVVVAGVVVDVADVDRVVIGRGLKGGLKGGLRMWSKPPHSESSYFLASRLTPYDRSYRYGCEDTIIETQSSDSECIHIMTV